MAFRRQGLASTEQLVSDLLSLCGLRASPFSKNQPTWPPYVASLSGQLEPLSRLLKMQKRELPHLRLVPAQCYPQPTG